MLKKPESKPVFGFDRPEDSPGFLLWQTTMVWQRLIRKALEPHDITHPQFVIMVTLLWFEMHPQDTTQIHIVNWTKLDKMTVSKAIKKLVALRLVHRVDHESDARAKSIFLTHKGRVLVGELIPLVEKQDSLFFNGLPKKDQQILITLLARIAKENRWHS